MLQTKIQEDTLQTEVVQACKTGKHTACNAGSVESLGVVITVQSVSTAGPLSS